MKRQTVTVVARRAAVALAALLVLAACGGQRPEADATEGACMAAQVYYNSLFAGDSETFLNGFDGAADMPDSYRQQLGEACQQFVARQQRHGGVADVTVARACEDSALHVMQVLLCVTFADSVSEEIAVPMVQRGDVWLMH